jgi:hypothetical protein
MKRLLLATLTALVVATLPVKATSISVSPTFLGCTQPHRVAIDASGGAWFPCTGVLAALFYAPGVYGAALPPPIAITSIPLPAGVVANMMAFDASNNIWFTDSGGNRVGRANKTTKVVTMFPMPAGAVQPEGIVYASDGNVYVSTFGNGKLYKVTPAGTMTVATSLLAGHKIRGLAVSGSQMVFGDFDTCEVHAYSPIFGTVPPASGPCEQIWDVAFGPDGNVWYAGGTKIGKFTSDGPVAYDPPPGTNAISLSPAPDGTIWFSGDNGLAGHARLGQITTKGLAVDAPVPGATALSTAGYVAVRQSDGVPFFTLTGDNKYGFVLPAVATKSSADLIEYYWAAHDHYFVTADPAEIAFLDASPPGGWVRTGGITAHVWARTDEPLPNASPVCRYYGLPSAGLDSHFYSASVSECQAVTDLFPTAWAFESRNVFMVVLPNATTGACPDGTAPLYRVYNNRADANHRYTGSLATRATMIGLGWIPEGYGPVGVAMCVPVN